MYIFINRLKKIRAAILVTLTHYGALPILKVVRKPNPFPYTIKELEKMPSGTVGRDLAEFTKIKGIQLLKDYERHDMKHLLLGFDVTEKDEICMQSFMLGNGRISFPVLITVLFGLTFAPEYWNSMHEAYSNGKKYNPVHDWNWFALIPEKSKEVHNRIFTLRTQ